MSNQINKMRIGLFTLIIWFLQSSAAFAVSLPVEYVEDNNLQTNISVLSADYKKHSNISSVDQENCHPTSNFSCDMEQCTNCMFLIVQEFQPALTISTVKRLEAIAFESLRQNHFIFYRPPQINS